MPTEPFVPQNGPAPLQQTPEYAFKDRRFEMNKIESEALYNQALNNWNFQNYVDLLNYQNKYNSFSEEMARAKEAGLNANMVAAKLSGTPMNAGSAPGTEGSASGAISSHQPNLLETIQGVAQLAQMGMNMADQYLNFGRTRADISHTKALTEGVMADTELARANAALARWNTERSKGLYQFDLSSAETHSRLLFEQAKNMAFENASYFDKLAMAQTLNDAQVAKMKEEVRRSRELLPHEKEYMLKNIDKTVEEARNLKKQGKILDKENMIYNARTAADIASKMGSGKLSEQAAKLVYGGLLRTEFGGRTAAANLQEYVTDHSSEITSAVTKSVDTLGKMINRAVDDFNNTQKRASKKIGQTYQRVKDWSKQSYNANFYPRFY